MIKSKKQSLIVIGAFILVLCLLTTTYAFFNYTRTGTANTIRTGRISFNTSQSNTLNLTNVFPMSSTQAGTANLDAVSVRIWGDTTYADGEEFEISIVDVNNTIESGQSAKTIPINYIASYTATPVQSGDPNVIGESSDSYFTARGQSSPVYQLSTTGEATNGEQVLIGYIPSGATGVDGTLTIKAYLDSSKIAISDTYPSEETDANSDGYIDGTPASFGEGKTVLTTTEWNSLQNTQTPLSFKIKAVSQEGTWVEEPVVTPAYPTIASCEGCKFIYTENEYFYSANNYDSSPISTLTTFENNNETLVDDYTTLNKNYFLGFKFDGNGVITNAYACGIKGTDYLNDEEQTPGVNAGTAFCVEGSTDGSTYSATNTFLNDSTTGIWQGRCDVNGSGVYCNGSVNAYAFSNGSVGVEDDDSSCDVSYDGSARCYLS